MGKKETLKIGTFLVLGAVIILTILYYTFKMDPITLKVIAAFLAIMIPGIMAAIKSEKVSNIISKFIEGQTEINEFIKHRKEIDSLCQLIEKETSETFGEYSEINPILSDYITDINDKISLIIEKKYSYDFDLFDSKYFKKQILIKLKHVTTNINYVMIDKSTFKKINKKVQSNVEEYIQKLSNLKDLENGKRRTKFKEETLTLTQQITNHSIDIYKTKKEIA